MSAMASPDPARLRDLQTIMSVLMETVPISKLIPTRKGAQLPLTASRMTPTGNAQPQDW